jgi:hypothetical protein
MNDDIRALSPLLIIAGVLIAMLLGSAFFGCKAQYVEEAAIMESDGLKRFTLRCRGRLTGIQTDSCVQEGAVTTFDWGTTTYQCFCRRND